MSLTWNDLFLSGSVVDLNVGQWSGRTKLSPQDLGIEASDAVSKALSLGHHKLVPARAFDDINNVIRRAKDAVDGHSLSFGFIRGARYVPEKNLEKLTTTLKALKAEFDSAVETFVYNYDEVCESMIPVIRQALLEAAKTPDAAEMALARVREQYPDMIEIRNRFRLTWSVYAIRGPSSKAALASGDEVKDVLKGMISDLRGQVSGKLGEVLAIIQRGGNLKPRSIESALEVLARVEDVNVFGDVELANQINRIRVVLQTVERGKALDQATVTGLEDVKKLLEADVSEAVAAAEAGLTGLGRRKLDLEVA